MAKSGLVKAAIKLTEEQLDDAAELLKNKNADNAEPVEIAEVVAVAQIIATNLQSINK